MAETIGSFSVGAGGNYATWKAATDDIGATLTGDMTFTQTSTLTETNALSIAKDLAGFTLKFTSTPSPDGLTTGSVLLNWNADNDFLTFSGTGSGTIEISNMHLKTVVSQTAGKAFIYVANISVATTFDIHGCLIDGNALGANGVEIDSGATIMKVYNNHVWDFVNNVNVVDCNRDESKFENITSYAARGYGIMAVDGQYRNCVSFNSTSADFYDIATSSGYSNASSDTTAQNANWASAASNRVSITPAMEFSNLTDGTDRFLRLVNSGVLAVNGTAPKITTNTTGIRTNGRPGDDGVYSIGADEYVYDPAVDRPQGEVFSVGSVKDAYVRINTYNGRVCSMNNLQSGSKSFISNNKGHLYAVAGTSHYQHQIFRSEDGGFSWNIYTEPGKSFSLIPRVGDDPDGNCMHLFYSEINELVHAICPSVGDALDLVKYTPDAEDEEDEFTGLNVVNFLGDTSSFTGNPDKFLFWTFQTLSNGHPGVNLLTIDPLFPHPSYADLTPASFYTYPIETYDTVADEERNDNSGASGNALLHMAWVCGDKQADANAPIMTYFNFIRPTISGGLGSWNKATQVWRGSGRLHDPGIAVDGQGTLAIVCSHNPSGNSDRDGDDLQLFVSHDDGTSWASGQVPRPTGTSGYIDLTQSNPVHRCSIIGDRGSGFMLGAIHEQNNSSDVYVTEFDGYTWPEATEWKRVNSDQDDRITGYQFFRTNNGNLHDIKNKGSLRIAYQIGHGNSEQGGGSVQTQVRTEKLTNNAYPLGTTVFSDTAYHMNYYASGLIGGNTNKYMSAFSLASTAFSVDRYEPQTDVRDTGKGAYTLSDTYLISGFFDPGTGYVATKNPFVTSGDEETGDGTFFLPPNEFLPINFIRNKGNFAKKTEYILKYQSKEYSLLTIIPRFIHNQIVHWECESFIVGPTYNPFTRILYPSEF